MTREERDAIMEVANVVKERGEFTTQDFKRLIELGVGLYWICKSVDLRELDVNLCKYICLSD